MKGYNSYSNQYQSYQNKFGTLFNKYDSIQNSFLKENFYTPSVSDKSNKKYVNSISESLSGQYKDQLVQHQPKERRSNLDRLIDTLMTANYMVAGFADGEIKNVKNVLSGNWSEFQSGQGIKQAGQGFMAGVGGVLGQGNKDNEYTFGRVLETAGWKPEHWSGKLAKGTIGFVMDVMLDPTTYMTSGLSAVAKGTGRVGKAAQALDKLGENIPRLIYDNTVERMIGAGLTPELAERYATKKLASDSAKFANPSHMTTEMAEQILLRDLSRTATKNNVPIQQVTKAELRVEATKLSKDYNKALGVFAPGNVPHAITFGVGNLPFGDKLARKLGPLGKTVTIVEGKSVRAFSDKVGLSTIYAGIRNNIYGSKIGKILSTTAPRVAWAQMDPAELYKLVKATDALKGKDVDKIAGKKNIHDIAKAMNLTPYAQKELLNVMENAKLTQPIRAILRFAETTKAQEMRKSLVAQKNMNKKNANDIMNKISTLESSLASESKLTKEFVAEYKQMEIDFAQQLKNFDQEVAKFDPDPSVSFEQLQKAIETITNSRDKLTKRIRETGVKANEMTSFINLPHAKNQLLKSQAKLTKNYNQQVFDLEKKLSDIDQSKGKKGTYHANYNKQEMDALRDTINKEIDSISEKLRLIHKSTEASRKVKPVVSPSGHTFSPHGVNRDYRVHMVESIKEHLTRTNTKAPDHHALSKEFSDELSFYVYGHTGAIIPLKPGFVDNKGHDFAKNVLERALDSIELGHPPHMLQSNPIFKDGRLLSPKAVDVRRFVAEEMGFKFYGRDIADPLAKLQKIGTSEDGSFLRSALSPEELVEYDRLIMQTQMRQELFDSYYGKMSTGSFYKYRDEINAERLRREYFGDLTDRLGGSERFADDNAFKRDGFIDNDSALVDESIGKSLKDVERVNFHNSEQILDDVSKQFEALEELIPSMPKLGSGETMEKLSRLLSKIEYTPSEVVAKMDMLLLKYAGGALYEDLPSFVQKIYAKATLKEVISTHRPKPKSGTRNRLEPFPLKNGLDDLYVAKKDGSLTLDNKVLMAYNRVIKSTIDKEIVKRAEFSRIERITDSVNDGSMVRLNDGSVGTVVMKDVSSDGVTFHVVMSDDTVKKVISGDIKSFTKEGTVNTDTLLNRDSIQRYLGSKKELLDKLASLRAERVEISFPKKLSNQKYAEATGPLLKERDMLKASLDSDLAALPLERAVLPALKRQYDRDVLKRVELNKELRSKRYQLNKHNKIYQDYMHKQFTHREALIDDFNMRYNRQEQLMREHDTLLRTYRDTLDSLDPTDVDKHIAKVAEIEKILKSDDTLEDFIRLKQGDKYMDDVIKEESGYNAVMSVIDDMPLTEQQKEWGKLIRDKFWKAGLDEVKIGKLKAEQFEKIAHNYIYHKATPEYERFLARQELSGAKHSTPTQDYGFGTKWANSSRGRTQTGTIDEFNEYMHDALKGKNAFSDSISDIFVVRMLKHEELMYDHKVTQTMMNRFGTVLKDGEKAPRGFKAVANWGNLREKFTADARESMGNELKQLSKEYNKDRATQAWDKARAIFKRDYEPSMGPGSAKNTKADKDEVLKKLFDKFMKEDGGSKDLPEAVILKLFQKHMDQVTESYGFRSAIFGKEAMPMLELNAKQVEHLSKANLAYSLSDSIVEKANLSRKIKMVKDESMTLQMYDKFLHWVKVNQTAIMPAFHVRNKYSNMFQSWLGVGRDAFDLKIQANAWRTIVARGDYEKLKNLKPMVSDDGTRVFHWNDIYDMAVHNGVIDEGFFAQDLSRMTESKGLFSKWIDSKYDPTSTEGFAPYKFATHWGSNVEGSDRLIHFASMLRQGKTIDEASESAVKYLFDYADLTSFERNVMKRIIPYYTWLRKNARLQLGEVLEQPEKYQLMAKIHRGIEGGVNEEDRAEDIARPNYARDWVQTPFSAGGNPILLSPNMPYMDIAQLFNPSRPIDSARNLFSQSSVVLKLPVEFALNWNSSFDGDIAREDDNKILAYSDHLLSELAPWNATKQFGKENSTRKAFHMLNIFSGVKMMPYNEQLAYADMMEQMFREKKREDQFFRMVDSVGSKAVSTVVMAHGHISDAIAPSLVELLGPPPMEAQDYRGAMSPISYESFQELSESDKQKYIAPTAGDFAVYNKEAQRLSDEAFANTGVVKKFVWGLFDPFEEAGYNTTVRVDNVADGDTFSYVHNGKKESVRLLMIDTPETVDPRLEGPQPYGPEASDFTKSMLMGKDVHLHVTGTDKYGRVLAYVEVDDQDFNKMLLEQGLATMRFLDDIQDYKKKQEYFKVEKKAYNAKKGIWEYPGYSKAGKDSGFNTYAIPGN